MQDTKFVITIGRQFGSGARKVGRIIADRLGIAFYDNELLMEAAKESGLNVEFFQKNDEVSPSIFRNVLMFNYGLNIQSVLPFNTSSLSDESLYNAQTLAIEVAAEKSSCVIIGRTADYILRHHPHCYNIFLYSSLEHRVKHLIERGECSTESEAETLALKKNRLRESYYNFYTDKRWGVAESYDLCLNVTRMTDEEVADMVIEYVMLHLKK